MQQVQQQKIEVWTCVCQQNLGVITLHEIVMMTHGQPIITDGTVRRVCPKCKIENIASPLDKRSPIG